MKVYFIDLFKLKQGIICFGFLKTNIEISTAEGKVI